MIIFASMCDEDFESAAYLPIPGRSSYEYRYRCRKGRNTSRRRNVRVASRALTRERRHTRAMKRYFLWLRANDIPAYPIFVGEPTLSVFFAPDDYLSAFYFDYVVDDSYEADPYERDYIDDRCDTCGQYVCTEMCEIYKLWADVIEAEPLPEQLTTDCTSCGEEASAHDIHGRCGGNVGQFSAKPLVGMYV